LGGQGPKTVRVPRKYSHYKNIVNKDLKGEQYAKATKTLAPLVGVATGHQEVGAAICAMADAYLCYKKERSVSKAAYVGTKSFLLGTTPGYVASKSISFIENRAGIDFDTRTEGALRAGISSGIKHLEERGFELIEGGLNG
jgi:hypothetical protein